MYFSGLITTIKNVSSKASHFVISPTLSAQLYVSVLLILRILRLPRLDFPTLLEFPKYNKFSLYCTLYTSIDSQVYFKVIFALVIQSLKMESSIVKSY